MPAGVPVSVQNFAFVTGTYGLMQDFLLKQVTSQGVNRNGVLTIEDVSDEWSAPEQIGDRPAQGWVTRLPDIELAPLAPNEVVLVGSLTEFSGPIQIVFAPVGLIGFGPFHIPAGTSCCRVASSPPCRRVADEVEMRRSASGGPPRTPEGRPHLGRLMVLLTHAFCGRLGGRSTGSLARDDARRPPLSRRRRSRVRPRGRRAWRDGPEAVGQAPVRAARSAR